MARGFSLVELLISISIIGIITSVVLVKFTDFDSTTILKGTAYEVASTIREAQVLSISVLGAGVDGFRSTYGVHFEKGSPDYIVFRDSSPLPNENPFYNVLDDDVDTLTTYSTTRGITIHEICIKFNGPGNCVDVESLDVSFRRPEFSALYYAPDGVSGESFDQDDFETIEYAKITLKSDNGSSNVWNVTIGALGHIAVVKD